MKLYREVLANYGISMPFPLAHPAAVLPLRRYCPRFLSFPALVIGSLTPDAGYAFGEGSVGAFSHRFIGTLGFSLPLGLVLVTLFYVLRTPAVGLLPPAYREALLPACRRPLGSFWVVAISVLLGSCSHVLWDSFTHTEGWFVQHWPLLQSPVLVMGSRTARVCHLLWYGCSFAGVGWLLIVFEKWKLACSGKPARGLSKAALRDSALGAILVLPLGLVHHFVHGPLGMVLIVVLCFLLVAGFVLKGRRRSIAETQSRLQPMNERQITERRP